MYNVGDKVKVIGNGTDAMDHFFSIGQEVVVIKEADSQGDLFCRGEVFRQFVNQKDVIAVGTAVAR